ncbi:MAG: BrnT family toxin [Rhizobacter sp.]|nr:BrnT family toxin [Bacteriovorax sp.]
MKITSFDWDDGNLKKLKKHKVPIEEIEDFIVNSDPVYLNDLKHSSTEFRFIAIGLYKERNLFIVFTFRIIAGIFKVRVISARYVRKKEIRKLYEEIKNKKEIYG